MLLTHFSELVWALPSMNYCKSSKIILSEILSASEMFEPMKESSCPVIRKYFEVRYDLLLISDFSNYLNSAKLLALPFRMTNSKIKF